MGNPNPNQAPKKPYQHYSAQQIMRMQELYGKNTHSDEKERRALSRELGLDPLRVKFWFQNRRSQNKKKDVNVLNKQLKEENEKLRVDNGMLRHAVGSPICTNCGGPSPDEISASRVELLRAENSFIKEEISRVTHVLEKYCGMGVPSSSNHAAPSSAGASDSDDGLASDSSAADNDSAAGQAFTPY